MTPEEAKNLKVGDVYYYIGVISGGVRCVEVSDNTLIRIYEYRDWGEGRYLTKEEAEECLQMKKIQEVLQQ